MTAAGLPEAVSRTLAEALSREIGRVDRESTTMSGHSCRISTGEERLFVKWSRDPAGARAIQAEVHGLSLLGAAAPDSVVNVRVCGPIDGDAGFFAALQWIESGGAVQDFGSRLAGVLDRIHGTAGEFYGLDRSNFIGATPQPNDPERTWPEFFRDRRLIYQRELLSESGRWPARWSDPFEQLLSRLGDLLPEAPVRSLLHGDLWSGNVMRNGQGFPVLIDPAVYYGHFETDLAMMRLFGGFGADFFARYRERRPPEPGAAERVEIYQLYHILNHVNLFGAAYEPQAERIICRFG